MELQEVLEKRQSIRRYKEGDIPKEHIMEMIKAAGMAPSGKNIQNWHFVCFSDQDIKDKLAKIIADKNEAISSEMDKVDEAKGARFRKFCKNLTLFFTKAQWVAVIYTTTYLPSGYHELSLIDADEDTLYDIRDHRSPGMQSLGAALENFTLKAIDLGYSTCWLTSANYAAAEIEEFMKEEYGFEKEGYYMGAMFSIGIPQDDQPSPPKKTPEEICTFL